MKTKKTINLLTLAVSIVSILTVSACEVQQKSGGSNGTTSTSSLSVPESMKDILGKVCPTRLTKTTETSSNNSSDNSSDGFSFGNPNCTTDKQGNKKCDTSTHSHVSNLILSDETRSKTITNNGTNFGTIGSGGQTINVCNGDNCGNNTNSNTVDNTSSSPSSSTKQAISEQDEGRTLADGTKLYAENIAGALYVEPSTDGKVSWAARKWVTADTQASADAAMPNSKITSTTDKGEARVIVDHPDSKSSLNYKTCLVIQAPAEWIQSLRNQTGDISVTNQTGDLSADTNSGSILITKHGAGAVYTNTTSGSIDVETNSSALVNLSSGAGSITLNQSGSGSVKIETTSGSINSTLSKAPAQSDGLIQSNAGSILLTLDGDLALDLDVQTTIGNIGATSEFPEPTQVGVTGYSLIGKLNGGGSTLAVKSGPGSISINASGSFVSTQDPGPEEQTQPEDQIQEDDSQEYNSGDEYNWESF